jgi:outer membrane receptor protein involved in Fe transport
LRGDSPIVGERDQFNPKFGITWEPIPGTTLRAAVFRTLKRTLITDQTLEPTQVAGFNQFFDEASQTEAWRYGGAVDQKLRRDLFGGVEFSKRDLKTPFLVVSEDPSNPIARRSDWDEYLGRGYLFWTPHPWLALSGEYLFERFQRDERFTDGVKELDTHRVPLGIRFFHPFGLSASLTTTYVNQHGMVEAVAVEPHPLRSASDNFWLVDAAINYRLPKRHGFITVGATNLFDEKFKFFDIVFDNPSIQPARTFFGRVTLAFP